VGPRCLQVCVVSDIHHFIEELWFTKPGEVAVRQADITQPHPGQVLVANHCSAVSAGTELLLYRGQIPQQMALDASIASLQEQSTYPLRYGYASVGRIVGLGEGVDKNWLNRRVFAFQPHGSHFLATPEQLIAIPDDVEDEDAVFLANMETAVNLVQDGAPLLGERVAVLGFGVVGLLLASILRQFPLQQLVGADALPLRRDLAMQTGVTFVADPNSAADVAKLRAQLNNGADLIYEVTGAPAALNLAIDLSGFASRIVIGSWYGEKSAPIFLGGDAHRNRLKIITSQVSTLAPELSGRWDKARRFTVAWEMLRQVQPSQWISHRAPLAQAPELYRQLDHNPQNHLQVLFRYSHS
jgi:Threonine dehydrogenase and related Zn-dependent dehydrogenases